MTTSTSQREGADRNLLLAVLAVQMDFVGRDELIEGMNAWVLDKATPLGQILVGRGRITAGDLAALNALVDRHLERHGGNPQKSLDAIRSQEPFHLDLSAIADPEVQASLAGFGPAYPETIVPPTGDGSPTSDGPARSAGTAGSWGPAPPSASLRFRKKRFLARGNLGEVYVAQDEELQREVALKEIQGARADDPESRSKFLLEAAVTGGLEHPGIVPVYGLGIYPDGRPHYAMRLIRGESLYTAIQRFHQAQQGDQNADERALELRKLLDRFVDMCNAIAYAHSRGWLHRDIKPANVMLGPYGETLVVDWGLAKKVGRPDHAPQHAELTLSPELAGSSTPTYGPLGTPAYMSPEQAACQFDSLGPASDVYSLGATLYHLLTGKTPFEGSSIEQTLARVQRGDFPRPRASNESVPPALEAVCLKAMALRPQDRYATARELAEDVQRWLGDQPVLAYPEPWTLRTSRWVRRNRVALSLASLVLMAALAASALFLWYVAHQDNQHLIAEQRHLNEEIGMAQHEKARLDAERNRLALENELKRRESRARSIQQVSMSFSLGEFHSALEGLRQCEREFPDSLDRFDVRYLRELIASERHNQLFEGHTGDVAAVHVFDDGRTMLSAAEDGTIRNWDLETGQSRSVRPFLPGRVGLALRDGPDGSIVVGDVVSDSPAGKSGKIQPADRLLSVAEGDDQAVPVKGMPLAQAIQKIQGPQGSTVTLHLERPATGEKLTVSLNRGPASLKLGYHSAFSPDGKWLAFTDDGLTGVSLVETATGTLHRPAFTPPPDAAIPGGATRARAKPRVCALAIDRDSRRIAIGFDHDPRIFVGDLTTRKWLKSFRGTGGLPAGASWSPDGSWLYVGNGGDVGLGAWDVATGQRAWQPTPNIISPGHGMRLSDDGTWLVWDGGEASSTFLVKVRPPRTDETTEYHLLTGAAKVYPPYAISPSGTFVAMADDSRILLWHTNRAQLLRIFESERGVIKCLAFSSNSQRLIAGVGNRLVLYNLDEERGSQPLTFGVGDHLTATAFDPVRGQLITAIGGAEPEVHAQVASYDLSSGEPAGRLFGPDWPRRAGNIAVSPDGQRLAVVLEYIDRDELEESLIEIWDLTARRKLSTGKLPLAPGPTDLSYSPDGSLLAVSRAKPLAKDDPQGSRSLHRYRVYPVFLIDGRTAEIRDRLIHAKSCYVSRFSADGKRLATLSGGEVGEQVTVWDLQRRAPIGKLAVQANTMDLSPDGRWLATAYHGPSYSMFGRPPTFTLYDLETFRSVASWKDEKISGRVDTTTLYFSPDGKRLAAGTAEGYLRIWDRESRKLIAEGRVPGTEEQRRVLFSIALDPSQESLLVSTGSLLNPAEGAILRWDPRAGRFESLKEQLPIPLLGVPARSGLVAAVSGLTTEVVVWDAPAKPESVLTSGRVDAPAETSGPITALAIDPRDRYIGLVDDDQTVRLVDRKLGKVVHSWEKVGETIEVLRFSPDGQTLYGAGRYRPSAGAALAGLVVSWDVETHKETLRWKADELGPLAANAGSRFLAFVDLSSDARLAAFIEASPQAGKPPAIQVWDVASGQRRATLNARDVDLRSHMGVCFEPSGKSVFSLALEGLKDGSAGIAYFIHQWNLETGEPMARWQVSADVNKWREHGAFRMAVTPDGQIAAVGKFDGRVDLWDVGSGRPLMTLDLEKSEAVSLLRFAPDGKSLVAATPLGHARVFWAR